MSESSSVPAPDPGRSGGDLAGVQGGPEGHRAATRSALDAGRGAPNLNDRGQGHHPKPPTFGDVAPSALALRRLRWSPGSAARFDGVHQNYVTRWDLVPVASIDRRAVLAWVAELHRAGVGASTQVKALAIFRAVWAEAGRDGLVGDDPSAGVTIRKPPYVMGRALNEKELARLLAAATDDQFRAQILLTAVCGLRWGELAGLSTGDPDFDNGLIHVRASLARGQAGYELKAPKTASSARAVPIPHVMDGLLRRVVDGRSGPLFVTKSGRRLNYHTSRRTLIRTADAGAVVDCTGWHVLRRTAATLALRSGVNLKDVSALLGHTGTSLTLSAYVAAREMLALAGPLDALAKAALDR